MGKQKKLKTKIPQHPQPGRHLRLIALQALFFIGLAAFGFSVVLTLVGDRSSAEPIRLAPHVPVVNFGPAQPVEAAGLFEAPSQRPRVEPSLSPIFTPSVQYWEEDLLRWAAEYEVDPNLAATVMQIESCGNPSAQSSAGASGLFQVMPFHFEDGEEPFDPETNAKRGLDYLARGLEVSGGHAGLALAGYNGGHSVIARDYEDWAYETQRYYRWGSGIYREASAGWESSPTLSAWLAAGGASLCAAAEEELGLTARGLLPTAAR